MLVVTREVAEDDREGHFLRFKEVRMVDQGHSAPRVPPDIREAPIRSTAVDGGYQHRA
jgi:hypothetical protein